MRHRFVIVDRIQRQLLRAIARIVYRPQLTLTVALLTAAACAILAATSLPISSDQNELFSPNVPFFRDYLSFIHDFPENEAAYVLVSAAGTQTPAVPDWARAADAIAARLRLMPQYVVSVDQRVPSDQLGAQGLLFDDPARVHQTRDQAAQFAQLIKIWAESPSPLALLTGNTPTERFLHMLGAAPDTKTTAPLIALVAQSWTRTLTPAPTTAQSQPASPVIPDLANLDATDPSRLGYYFIPDAANPARHILLVRVYPQENFTSLTATCQAIDAIRQSVADVAKGFPQFAFGLSGRPVLEADEMRTTDTDSHHAEILALITIFLGLVLMLRSVLLALAAEAALLVGIGWTFGWATVSVGRLNLLSIVFLIALIGIGMDYLIQILTRYRSEAARRGRSSAIWHSVFRHVGAPINTACLGAAGAFLASLLTQFRGAAELGIIAGVGLLLCLLAGYTVLPALLTIFPVKVPPEAAMPAGDDAVSPPPTRRWIIGPILWLALLVALVPQMHKARFDSNLLNLQAKGLQSVDLVRSLPTWSATVLSKDLSLLAKVRTALTDSPTVDHTESLLDAQDNWTWLRDHASTLPKINWKTPAVIRPSDLSAIADAARALARHLGPGDAASALTQFADVITKASPQQRADFAPLLSSWQRSFVDRLRVTWSQFDPPPLDAMALPPGLRNHLITDQGVMALYIYPKADLWKGSALTAFVDDIEKRVATVPGAPAPTGIAVNIDHSTASIHSSFYHATTYALILIVLLVWIDLRDIRLTLLAISVLGLGLPMLLAIMGTLDVRWNFANFFALPILIGAGHEYGVFLVHRYVEGCRHPRRVWLAWDVSDRALLLCAFVTSTSFFYFWLLGHHQGLRSLGLVMALGTACIYLSAVVVLRPVLVWNLRQKRAAANSAGAESLPCPALSLPGAAAVSGSQASPNHDPI